MRMVVCFFKRNHIFPTEFQHRMRVKNWIFCIQQGEVLYPPVPGRQVCSIYTCAAQTWH
ncbi:predicted protein [Plenodomus lingam JN3]|uniref:Predicted protein n=1 Tax=Leptosphaeria maculans (strain JN3 / isolate v23.1.3 / race Av1-4-5-6-7-8) TaxID=985895 RepID=E5A920_LEPMJ|nr:predicted protein [Plenodomus lingam JN3]CBY00115.1 predicted protein [Plenodomus lingam JN3]